MKKLLALALALVLVTFSAAADTLSLDLETATLDELQAAQSILSQRISKLRAAAAPAGSGELAATEEPACRRLEVHTRPPIHWLNFHRAGEAIEAGGRALDAFMPAVARALSRAIADRQAAGSILVPAVDDALA